MTEPGVGGAVGQVEPSVGDRSQGDGGHLSCPSCSAHVTAGERFCEACGADLAPSPASAEAVAPAAEAVAPADESVAPADESVRLRTSGGCGQAFGSAVLR